MALIGEHFTSSDGLEVYYEYHKGRGPVLLFLYGLGCEIFHWKYQMDYFLQMEEGPSLLWLDYRGHGKSEKLQSRNQISLDLISGDIAELLSHLHISSVVLLGQSMGGTIALHFAYDHQDLIDKMVLQGAPPFGPSKTLQMGMAGKIAWLSILKLNRTHRKLVKKGFDLVPRKNLLARELVRNLGFNPKLAKTEDIEGYIEGIFRMDPNVFFDLADEMENFSVVNFRNEMNIPTLIFAGEQDFCVGLDKIKVLEDHITDCRIEVIPQGSHCPHLDDPEKINTLIEQFIYNR